VAVQFTSLPGLHVKVDRVLFDPKRRGAPERPFVFIYYISIQNTSSQTVVLFGRKWVVKDEQTGSVLVVEGDGIVGETPRLAPGESFRYNSSHTILHQSTASGAFFGTTDSGVPIRVAIPDFNMQPPMLA
jgi:ApaG protein